MIGLSQNVFHTFLRGVTEMSERLNDLVRNLPVADFYYKGPSHSHPVRRRVLVTNNTKKLVTGYELREGNIIRDIDSAPIKSYRRDRIATRGQCRVDSTARKVPQSKLTETTFMRKSLRELAK